MSPYATNQVHLDTECKPKYKTQMSFIYKIQNVKGGQHLVFEITFFSESSRDGFPGHLLWRSGPQLS